MFMELRRLLPFTAVATGHFTEPNKTSSYPRYFLNIVVNIILSSNSYASQVTHLFRFFKQNFVSIARRLHVARFVHRYLTFLWEMLKYFAS
jgi:hypothetical protein